MKVQKLKSKMLSMAAIMSLTSTQAFAVGSFSTALNKGKKVEVKEGALTWFAEVMLYWEYGCMGVGAMLLAVGLVAASKEKADTAKWSLISGIGLFSIGSLAAAFM